MVFSTPCRPVSVTWISCGTMSGPSQPVFSLTAQRPELQVSLGYLIQCLNDSLVRFDRILQRPELNRLKSMNIKTIRNLHRWSTGVMQHPSVKWYVEHRILIRRISRIRFLLFIDPFSWIFLLSRKVVVLLLIRTLVLDITVYVGKVALNAYDQDHDSSEEDGVDIAGRNPGGSFPYADATGHGDRS
jgi:hypothetical protein